ncbi:MAG: DUF4423 domain-containing protein [Bdellovibrio sp.]|nr:DUF4423 domain-containing protein [Bdellovibrio sp.]
MAIKINDSPGSLNLKEHHRKCLNNAINALDSPAEKRKYRSLNMALSETEYQEVSEKISDFLSQLFTIYGCQDNIAGKRLFRLNYNISP